MIVELRTYTVKPLRMGAPAGDEESGGAPRRAAAPASRPAPPAAQRPAASKPSSGFDDIPF